MEAAKTTFPCHGRRSASLYKRDSRRSSKKAFKPVTGALLL